MWGENRNLPRKCRFCIWALPTKEGRKEGRKEGSKWIFSVSDFVSILLSLSVCISPAKPSTNPPHSTLTFLGREKIWATNWERRKNLFFHASFQVKIIFWPIWKRHAFPLQINSFWQKMIYGRRNDGRVEEATSNTWRIRILAENWPKMFYHSEKYEENSRLHRAILQRCKLVKVSIYENPLLLELCNAVALFAHLKKRFISFKNAFLELHSSPTFSSRVNWCKKRRRRRKKHWSWCFVDSSQSRSFFFSVSRAGSNFSHPDRPNRGSPKTILN